MGSWPCSGRRLPMRIMRSGPAMQPWPCKRRSGHMPTRSARPTRSRSRSGWGSIQGSGGPGDRQRFAYGLLGHRADHASGGPYGAAGHAWEYPPDDGDLRLAEELVQVKPLGPTPVRGLRQPWRSLSWWGRVPADPPPGLRRADARAWGAKRRSRRCARRTRWPCRPRAARGRHGGTRGGGRAAFLRVPLRPLDPGWLLLESHGLL